MKTPQRSELNLPHDAQESRPTSMPVCPNNIQSREDPNMKTIVTTAIALTLLLTPFQGASAQSRWSLDLQGGPAFATKDLGDADLGLGLGGDVTLSFRVQPHLWVYGGWSMRQFNAEQSFAGPDIDVEETGYLFGLRFEHPLGSSSTDLVLRAGGTVNHLELEDDEGNLVADSKHGLGWEVGAGLALPLGEAWRLTPGVRFRSLSRDIEIGTTTTPVDLRYVGLEVGVSRRF